MCNLYIDINGCDSICFSVQELQQVSLLFFVIQKCVVFYFMKHMNVLWETLSHPGSCTWACVSDWIIVCLCCCDSGRPEGRGGCCTEESSSDGEKAAEGERDADEETATGGWDRTEERSSTVRKTPQTTQHNNWKWHDHRKQSHTIKDSTTNSTCHVHRNEYTLELFKI